MLAARANTTRSYIASLEGGRIRNPGVESLYPIAQALGVTMEALMGRPSLTMEAALREPADYTMVHAQRELEARLPLIGTKPFDSMTVGQMEAYVPGVDGADMLEAAAECVGRFLAASLELPADWSATSFYAAGALAMALVRDNSPPK